jgi:hypothetical protein
MPILQGIPVITFDIQNNLHIKKSPTTLKNKELEEKNNLGKHSSPVWSYFQRVFLVACDWGVMYMMYKTNL